MALSYPTIFKGPGLLPENDTSYDILKRAEIVRMGFTPE